VEFEFDPAKSQANKAKHGIDFEEAQSLWLDPDGLSVPAKNIKSEIRFARIAQVENQIWFAVFTYRQNNVRLITVRKARKNEKRQYQSLER
jgi:uncharacterized DUF497 family protein